MRKTTHITAEKGQTCIVITREFKAPPMLVFSLYETPELFAQWSKPDGVAMEIERLECKTGGSFLWHHVHENGMQFSFYGVFHEVQAPTTIIKTSEFKGLPEKLLPVIEHLQFDPLGDQQTRLTITIYCPSESYRDGMLSSDMQAHFDHSFALLDELLSARG